MCDPAEMRGSALNQRGLGLGGLFALGGGVVTALSWAERLFAMPPGSLMGIIESNHNYLISRSNGGVSDLRRKGAWYCSL